VLGPNTTAVQMAAPVQKILDPPTYSGMKKQITEPNALLSVTEFATSSYDMEEYILLATYFHRMST